MHRFLQKKLTFAHNLAHTRAKSTRTYTRTQNNYATEHLQFHLPQTHGLEIIRQRTILQQVHLLRGAAHQQPGPVHRETLHHGSRQKGRIRNEKGMVRGTPGLHLPPLDGRNTREPRQRHGTDKRTHRHSQQQPAIPPGTHTRGNQKGKPEMAPGILRPGIKGKPAHRAHSH